MLFSIVLTVALVFYQQRVIRLTGSLAVGADEVHYRGDLFVNGAVLVSLLLGGWLNLPILDPLFGAAAGLYIVSSAWRVARLSLRQLMDEELPDEARSRIRAIAQAHPEVKAVHDIRTRAAGPTAFIQLHLEMDGGMTLGRAHQISDAVEAEVRKAYPDAEIIIHQDPEGVEEPRQTFPPLAAAS
jgi:ferrous-iron efflux pump FieF